MFTSSTAPMNFSTQKNVNKPYSFPIKGQDSLGIIELIGNPNHIDKEEAKSVLVESFIGEYEKYLSPSEISDSLISWRDGDRSVRKYYEDYFKTELEDFYRGDLHYWIQATVDGKLVGWATFQREHSEQNAVYMNLLVVHPEYQNRGIGGHLVKALVNLREISDLNAIHLLLRKKNQGGRIFYSKLGFTSDPEYQRADNFVNRDLLEGLTWKNPSLQNKDTAFPDGSRVSGMTKFLLIGLPGTGKTTTSMECVNLLRKQGLDCNCISTDSFINTRMNSGDKVIIKYEEDHRVKISPDIFTASNPSGAFITTYGEEPAFRDLEERFLKNDWFDFGGKALMRTGTVTATEAKKIVPVFLYAEHESIIARLEKNDGWRKRPTYVNAAEKSLDGKGWRILAATHRKDRLAKHIKGATIIISVEKTSADLLEYSKEEKQNATQFKSPEEIVREIFIRVKELKLVSLNSRSQFSNNCMRFFESKPEQDEQKNIDKQHFQETKEWLKSNLTLHGMKHKK